MNRIKERQGACGEKEGDSDNDRETEEGCGMSGCRGLGSNLRCSVPSSNFTVCISKPLFNCSLLL